MKTIGIYAIRNVLDGKCYIGQSVTIKGRKAYHFSALKKGIHHCSHLQRAYNKYGRDSFEHFIIELCSIEKLTEREQFWMDFYRCAGLYNARPSADSMQGYKHSEETKEKMRVSQAKEAVVEAKRNKIQEQRKDPLFVAASSRKGTKASHETKIKLSEGLKNRWADSAYKLKLSMKQKEAQKLTANEASDRMKNKWANPEFREYMIKCRAEKKASNLISKEY